VSDRPAWLPPDQTPTLKWPVVGERAPRPEALDLARFRLDVTGLVARPLSLTWPEVRAWPSRTLETDVHCVTRWSHRAMRFDGFPLSELLAAAAPLEAARCVRFVSASPRDHDTSLPIDVALRDTWVVHGRDGRPLEVEHGYPLRTVTNGRYFYKSLKWLVHIEVLDAHEPLQALVEIAADRDGSERVAMLDLERTPVAAMNNPRVSEGDVDGQARVVVAR